MSALSNEIAQIKTNLVALQTSIAALDAKIVALARGGTTDPAVQAGLDDLLSTSAALVTQAGADPTAPPATPPAAPTT